MGTISGQTLVWLSSGFECVPYRGAQGGFSLCKTHNKLEETHTVWDNFHHLDFKLLAFIKTSDLKNCSKYRILLEFTLRDCSSGSCPNCTSLQVCMLISTLTLSGGHFWHVPVGKKRTRKNFFLPVILSKKKKPSNTSFTQAGYFMKPTNKKFCVQRLLGHGMAHTSVMSWIILKQKLQILSF